MTDIRPVTLGEVASLINKPMPAVCVDAVFGLLESGKITIDDVYEACRSENEITKGVRRAV